MGDGLIYIIRNTIDNKIYIGQTRQEIKARLKVHKTSKTYFGNALRKYGFDKFDIKLLTVPVDCLSIIEKLLIEEYNCMAPSGYNLEGGGKRNYKISEITRKRLSKSHKGKKASPKTKTKMSKSRIGKKRPDMVGVPLSEEHRKKISLGNRGKKRTCEMKKKYSIAQKGKKLTTEHIEKIQEKRRKFYHIICPNGKIVITNKMPRFCKDHGLSYGTMFLVAQGKRNHYKNYKVNFLEN